LQAATSLARLWSQQGKRIKACDVLAPVYDWFGEGFDTPDLRNSRHGKREIKVGDVVHIKAEIDSNTVERSVRPIALNRKNALFAGSDEGAENWAMLASLVETCKR
jgi:hypothetical protein